ncbi:unnamed protein product [Microthlaspi erraticum]|uniref:Transposase-associated domain-containing protein n=1 Tax=Microthlaspi erraticum TaxID=1685480 RepID=A0A6D2HR50_9BRAS|nr:unnamed protein product [Microthlaspi erraticum]
MDKHSYDPVTGQLIEEFAKGFEEFMAFATRQELAMESGKIYCPCPTCRNRRFVYIKTVWNHIYRSGFMPGYKIWYSHGESEEMAYTNASASSSNRIEAEIRPEVEENRGTVQMVNDAFRENVALFGEEENRIEEPNLEARKFFDMLDAAKNELYKGCREGISPLSSATELMSIKTDFNLPEDCVDRLSDWARRMLPEDNLLAASYYEVQKLVAGLGLPYQMIDVCVDNCMIFWREDKNRSTCRFCRKPRYQETEGRVCIPYKRMWYLPISERLKRLYQSERTAESMRWHAEHTSNGEIVHPSDAKAWKHFQEVYPSFAYERRNVYLGLSTDGFNPFGKHGRQYSLWPVIVTPYNLPPSLCMKRVFLFLSILIPGPANPKRSLDVFLQPLIHELQMLWDHGVEVFDVSCQQNFTMRAVLMWTISDFPAYGMLSGWSM